jgi:predicted nucleic acid-binding protein
VIVDASVVVAALVDRSHEGRWARSITSAGKLEVPHLMPVEVCQVLRRRVASGALSVNDARGAMLGLQELDPNMHAFEPFASRAWELRDTVSAYDAWYVSLAEFLDAPLATLDARLRRAPGARCTFLAPG